MYHVVEYHCVGKGVPARMKSKPFGKAYNNKNDIKMFLQEIYEKLKAENKKVIIDDNKTRVCYEVSKREWFAWRIVEVEAL